MVDTYAFHDVGRLPAPGDTLLSWGLPFGVEQYADDHGYPLFHVPHHFLTLNDAFQADLERGAAMCGGSDIFSGISGNPLAAWVAKISRSYAPRLYAQGNMDFQVSRGLLGISL
jgi:hypothetical protein